MADISAVQAEQPVSLKAWLAVLGSALGAFLAVLNIQVVNAALADIQGALGAGIDDGGWISTAYLVTEIIVIPLTAWFSRVFSMRIYLLASTAFFLLFSVACAFTGNLSEMIVMRAAQGFAGGALIPLSFTLILTLLPKSKQPIGMALFAFSATFAPAIGPTIGGYLNENFGWQYIFYVNLVPGVVMLAMLWFSLERAPMQLKLLGEGDWAGIATMAIGLGALETVLEEGNKDDWFGSPFILWLSVISAVSLIAFLVIELVRKQPLVDLRLLINRNFGLASLAAFLLGSVLYGSVFILSLYLSQMQGYNAEQIGQVLAWVGLPQLVLIPLLPKLMRFMDARLMLILGFGLFAASNFMNVHLTTDVGADQLLIPNLVRAVGQALLLSPLAAAAVASIPASSAGNASAIFNMMRNLGGAVGIAGLQTFFTHRQTFHSTVITASVSAFGEATRARLEGLAQYFLAHGVSDPATAMHEAIVAVGRGLERQAAIMAYADTFFVMGVTLTLALLVSLFLRKSAGPAPAGAH